MSKGILLSGGLDSTALAFWKRPELAFTVDYGQKPAGAEIKASAQIAKDLGIKHIVISVDCSSLGSGHLAGRSSLELSPSAEWWPFRNQLLITLACMNGLSLGLNEIMIGSVKSDGFHIDGSKPFFDAVDNLVRLQEGHIRVSCPGIDLSSAELIRASRIPQEVLLWAHSCHKSSNACGQCGGCHKYLAVLQQLGIQK